MTSTSISQRPWLRSTAPFLVRNQIDGYPELANLSPEILSKRFGDTEVWVSGSGKEQRNVRWLKTSLRSYLDKHLRSHMESLNDRFYLSEDETLLHRWGLLPALRQYVAPLVPRSAMLFERSAVWLGQAGTRTGLHADPDGFNLLCQMYGTKRVYMLDDAAARCVRRSPRFDAGARTTDVDFWTTKVQQIVKCRDNPIVLRRGDILYVPRWCWHAAENIEMSVAFSYRAETPLSLLKNLPVEARHFLHNMGFYRKDNCTCHPTE